MLERTITPTTIKHYTVNPTEQGTTLAVKIELLNISPTTTDLTKTSAKAVSKTTPNIATTTSTSKSTKTTHPSSFPSNISSTKMCPTTANESPKQTTRTLLPKTTTDGTTGKIKSKFH